MQRLSLKENIELPQGFNNLWKKVTFIHFLLTQSSQQGRNWVCYGCHVFMVQLWGLCISLALELSSFALSVADNIVHLSFPIMIWKCLYLLDDSTLPPSAVSWILFPASMIWALNVSNCNSRRSFKYTWVFQLASCPSGIHHEQSTRSIAVRTRKETVEKI